MPHRNNIVVKAHFCVCTQHGNIRRNLSSTFFAMCNTCVLQSIRAYSLLNHSNQLPAHLSQAGYRHPLAQRDPSQRNIALPDSVHAKSGSADVLPAEVLQRRAQKALLLKMQQEVLWEGTVIDNVEHTLIQRFCKLASNPKYRNARNMMIVGGRELIRELCEKGHHPHHLLVTEGKVIPEWARKGRHNMELVLVKEHVADACMPGNDGFIGDFDIPPPPMKEELIANHQRFKRLLVLDNVDDAGVLGTLLRTAVGLVYDAVILINHCADLYDHRVVRAACGAHFQQGIPIYSLSDEDGDDVYGMLNHLLSRNKLLPLCFPTQDDMTLSESNDRTLCDDSNKFSKATTMEEWDNNNTIINELEQEKERKAQMPIFVSSVVGAQPVLLHTIFSRTKLPDQALCKEETNDVASKAASAKTQSSYSPKQEIFTSPWKDKLSIECNNTSSSVNVNTNTKNSNSNNRNNNKSESNYRPMNLQDYLHSEHRKETLSEFCLQSFSAHRDGPDPGYMLITGPNHKRTMTRRLREKMAAPLTQLMLDEINITDALIGYSVVMHALRPTGDWDYLPVHERTRPSHAKLQEEFASVDIGANRISHDADSINMTEEEQIQAAHERNLYMRWRRQKKRELTDYEHWMSAEERRVKQMLVHQEEHLRTPWKVSKRKKSSTSGRSQNIPDWVPNIIDDYRQPLDRTELREEQSRNENYVRPSNYDRYTRSTSQETH